MTRRSSLSLAVAQLQNRAAIHRRASRDVATDLSHQDSGGGSTKACACARRHRECGREGLGIGGRAAAATDATFRRLRVARDQANVDDGSAARQGKSRARMGHRRRHRSFSCSTEPTATHHVFDDDTNFNLCRRHRHRSVPPAVLVRASSRGNRCYRVQLLT